jgi:hypothetical protein
MSIEDDQDRLAQKVAEAIRSAYAGQPDALVFCLRGTEIQACLIEAAEEAEAEAERESLPKNVRPIGRPVHPSRPIYPQGHGYPQPPSSEEIAATYAAMAQERAKSLRANAKTFRFLAAHVEEDKYFRLGIHDLAFLGLVPSRAGQCGPMPLSQYLPTGM